MSIIIQRFIALTIFMALLVPMLVHAVPHGPHESHSEIVTSQKVDNKTIKKQKNDEDHGEHDHIEPDEWKETDYPTSNKNGQSEYLPMTSVSTQHTKDYNKNPDKQNA